MLRAVRAVTDALLSALLAPACASCARLLDHPLDGAVCETCWRAIAASAAYEGTMSPLIARGGAIGEYDGVLREVIHALKYGGRRSVAPRLSRMMADRGADILAGADAVVPVPLHPLRQRQRGFNQAEALSTELGLPVLRALTRVTQTDPQIDLSAADRQRNVRDAFAVIAHGGASCGRFPRPAAREVTGTALVLVDDVITTGATLEACARVLVRAGAREVRALTAARVATPPRPGRPR